MHGVSSGAFAFLPGIHRRTGANIGLGLAPLPPPSAGTFLCLLGLGDAAVVVVAYTKAYERTCMDGSSGVEQAFGTVSFNTPLRVARAAANLPPAFLRTACALLLPRYLAA